MSEALYVTYFFPLSFYNVVFISSGLKFHADTPQDGSFFIHFWPVVSPCTQETRALSPGNFFRKYVFDNSFFIGLYFWILYSLDLLNRSSNLFFLFLSYSSYFFF